MAKKQTRKKKTSGGAARTRSRRTGSAGAARSGGRRTAAKKAARPAKRTARKSTTRGAARGRGAKTTARRTPARRTGGQARQRTSGGGTQLSRSARSATWIESPDDLEQRPGQTLATRSHDVIRRWAEERGAEPSTIPGGDPGEPRVLRFNFPGFGGENLQPVEWDAWLRTFDDRNLVFLFQERLKNGNQSNFFRLDNPDREDA